MAKVGLMSGTSIFGSVAARDEFLKELQGLMRSGAAETALERARAKLGEVECANQRLVALAMESDFRGIALKGWHELGARFEELDAGNPEEPITALGIDFSWPGHTGIEPGADGKLAPHIETNYYSDLPALAFSASARDALLSGYSAYGSEWQGAFKDIDGLIEVEGLEALYGAVQQADGYRGKDDADGDAHALAAAISAILLHLAVKHTVEQRGLPRPLAVIVGSNEDYPFFDAPVVTYDEAAEGDDLPVPQFGHDNSGTSLEANPAIDTAPAGEERLGGKPEKPEKPEKKARIRTYVPRGVGAFAALGGTRQRATLDLNAPARNADGSTDTLELGYESMESPSGTSLRRRIATGDAQEEWDGEDERGFLSKIFSR
jgi:hypothetical protein